MSFSHDRSIRSVRQIILVSMQILDLDTIGTYLRIHIDTTSSCDEVFSTIRERLISFEEKYSRFLE
jgi:hypothetical protein